MATRNYLLSFSHCRCVGLVSEQDFQVSTVASTNSRRDLSTRLNCVDLLCLNCIFYSTSTEPFQIASLNEKRVGSLLFLCAGRQGRITNQGSMQQTIPRFFFHQPTKVSLSAISSDVESFLQITAGSSSHSNNSECCRFILSAEKPRSEEDSNQAELCPTARTDIPYPYPNSNCFHQHPILYCFWACRSRI